MKPRPDLAHKLRFAAHCGNRAAVLDVTATGIARIVVFGDPGLVTRFGFPPIDSPLEVIRS